jgi:hypothetical protein
MESGGGVAISLAAQANHYKTQLSIKYPRMGGHAAILNAPERDRFAHFARPKLL